MDIHYFDGEPVTLRMLPVCECGYVFRDGIRITQALNEIQNYKYAKYFIDPAYCPNCKKMIEGVVSEGFKR